MKKNIPKRRDSDRRLRQSAKFSRLLQLLALLRGHRRCNAKDLADELEVHERTIHRDLEVLELAGVPWTFDRRLKTYRIEQWYNPPAIPPTHDDLLDQAAAATIAAARGVSAGAGARTIVGHLAAHSPVAAARLLEDAQQFMAVLDLKLATQGRYRENLRAIQWSLLGKNQLVGRYASPYQSAPTKVALHPYRLCFSRQAWYLIARPAGAVSPRVYRVARFISLRPLDQPADASADFDLRAYLGNAWSIFRGDRRFDVELLFHADAARIVVETTWHHTQQVRRHADGSATLTFSVDGLDEIVWWLLGWAGFVTIVRPDELRAMFVAQLRAALARNGGVEE